MWTSVVISGKPTLHQSEKPFRLAGLFCTNPTTKKIIQLCMSFTEKIVVGKISFKVMHSFKLMACKDGGPSLKKLYQDFGFVTSARGKSFSVFPTSVVRRVRENNSVLAPSSGYYKTSFSIEYAPQWEERRRKAAMPSSW